MHRRRKRPPLPRRRRRGRKRSSSRSRASLLPPREASPERVAVEVEVVEVDSEVIVDPTELPEVVLPEVDEAVPVTTLRAPPPSPSTTSRPSPLWVLERNALVPGRSLCNKHGTSQIPGFRVCLEGSGRILKKKGHRVLLSLGRSVMDTNTKQRMKRFRMRRVDGRSGGGFLSFSRFACSSGERMTSALLNTD
jgi:hypothetical protein